MNPMKLRASDEATTVKAVLIPAVALFPNTKQSPVLERGITKFWVFPELLMIPAPVKPKELGPASDGEGAPGEHETVQGYGARNTVTGDGRDVKGCRVVGA